MTKRDLGISHELDEDLKEDGPRVNVRFEYDVDTVDNLYAWIATNSETGHEGLIYATIGNQKTLLIASTLRQILRMKKIANSVTRYMAVTVRCVQFVRSGAIIHPLADKLTRKRR